MLRPPDPPLSDGVITLRPFEDSDVDTIYDACQDPEIQRFIPVPRPYRRDDAVAYVRRTQRQWADGSKAAFAIVDANDPTTVLGAINVAISGSVGNSGYWITPAARGRGIATRALRLLTGWALGELGLGVVLLEIRPDNDRSIRVAQACGYHYAGRLDVNTATGKKGGLIFTRMAV
ncbi:MAG: GNAT family N-acetyltransferase [Acidimicrobiales bacterium]|nr:GNAT family N-acetyltransferase [Acidimicrobiales bacterium]